MGLWTWLSKIESLKDRSLLAKIDQNGRFLVLAWTRPKLPSGERWIGLVEDQPCAQLRAI